FGYTRKTASGSSASYPAQYSFSASFIAFFAKSSSLIGLGTSPPLSADCADPCVGCPPGGGGGGMSGFRVVSVPVPAPAPAPAPVPVPPPAAADPVCACPPGFDGGDVGPPRGLGTTRSCPLASFSEAVGENFAPHVRGAVICVCPIGEQSPVNPMKVKFSSAVACSEATTPSGYCAEQAAPFEPQRMSIPSIVPLVGIEIVNVCFRPGGGTAAPWP